MLIHTITTKKKYNTIKIDFEATKWLLEYYFTSISARMMDNKSQWTLLGHYLDKY